MRPDSLDAVLDFAIKNEQDAADFYSELASKMAKPHMRESLEGFAAEERGHKARLEALKAGQISKLTRETVLDLKIGDYPRVSPFFSTLRATQTVAELSALIPGRDLGLA